MARGQRGLALSGLELHQQALIDIHMAHMVMVHMAFLQPPVVDDLHTEQGRREDTNSSDTHTAVVIGLLVSRNANQ